MYNFIQYTTSYVNFGRSSQFVGGKPFKHAIPLNMALFNDRQNPKMRRKRLFGRYLSFRAKLQHLLDSADWSWDNLTKPTERSTQPCNIMVRKFAFFGINLDKYVFIFRIPLSYFEKGSTHKDLFERTEAKLWIICFSKYIGFHFHGSLRS